MVITDPQIITCPYSCKPNCFLKIRTHSCFQSYPFGSPTFPKHQEFIPIRRALLVWDTSVQINASQICHPQHFFNHLGISHTHLYVGSLNGQTCSLDTISLSDVHIIDVFFLSLTARKPINPEHDTNKHTIHTYTSYVAYVIVSLSLTRLACLSMIHVSLTIS